MRISSGRLHGLAVALVFVGGGNGPGEPGNAESRPESERIVLVVSRSQGGRETECMGFVYSRDWVVTAKHCVVGASAVGVLRLSGEERRVEAWRSHPTTDVCLLHVPALGAVGSAKIGSPSKEQGLMVSKVVRSPVPALHQGAAIPHPATSDRIRVTSELRPCRGDSGGPLLTLDGMIVGVLSRGSMSCDGRDEFVLLAPIAEWIGLTMEFSSGQARMSPQGAIRPGESPGGPLGP